MANSPEAPKARPNTSLEGWLQHADKLLHAAYIAIEEVVVTGRDDAWLMPLEQPDPCAELNFDRLKPKNTTTDGQTECIRNTVAANAGDFLTRTELLLDTRYIEMLR